MHAPENATLLHHHANQKDQAQHEENTENHSSDYDMQRVERGYICIMAGCLAYPKKGPEYCRYRTKKTALARTGLL